MRGSRYLSIALPAFLIGCINLGPDYERPDIEMSDDYIGEPPVYINAELQDSTIANLHWWEVFNDDDHEIFEPAIQPLETVSGEFDIFLGTFSDKDPIIKDLHAFLKKEGQARVKTEIIINVASHESRIAIIEDGRLVEILVERSENERMVGDIYKGIVKAVLPSLQAAFVDIGLERAAFLHVSDILGEEPGNESDIGKLVREGNEIIARRMQMPLADVELVIGKDGTGKDGGLYPYTFIEAARFCGSAPGQPPFGQANGQIVDHFRMTNEWWLKFGQMTKTVEPSEGIDCSLLSDLHPDVELSFRGEERCLIEPATEVVTGPSLVAVAREEIERAFAGREIELRLEEPPADVRVPAGEGLATLRAVRDGRTASPAPS